MPTKYRPPKPKPDHVATEWRMLALLLILGLFAAIKLGQFDVDADWVLTLPYN
ncbi:hypothetical protein N2599_29860 (plasmid) [Rhizobium sullae]|uniref:Uncharacterized protein n=1 Tax=Rhizobium sullae TaxID=50338 RepID=A0ABY5XQY2_RHISU|nr:hypothetical protein [Rhizobium sullae]UWU17009.1 hypothetical protein N2599_29860 [Rhizobium sullae]